MSHSPITRFLVSANVGIHILRVLYWWLVDPYSMQHVDVQFGLVPQAFWAGAIWQPVTAIFLHGTIAHLLLNMVSLWSLGDAVERTVGSFKFLLLYLVSGLTSSLFVVVFQSGEGHVPTVGASGAVLGLLGAIGMFYPRSKLLLFFIPMRAWTAVLFFGALSIGFILYDHVTGATSFLSHFGHLGGLIGGVVYSRLALQLPFLANELHGVKASGFRVFRPDPHRTTEEQLRAAMEELKREREQAKAPPVPEQEPFNQPIREVPHESGDRRIYFDPATGRFYVR